MSEVLPSLEHRYSRKSNPPRPQRLRDPLQLLPTELVWTIFQHLAPDSPHLRYELSELALSLSQVSKTWRMFVFDCPFLWRYIDISVVRFSPPGLLGLGQLLARSEEEPLFVNITVRDPDLDALRIIFSHAPRFVELRLYLSEQWWWDDIVSAAGFKQLRKFSVRTSRSSKSDPGRPRDGAQLSKIFFKAPSLCDLEWLACGNGIEHPGEAVAMFGGQLRSLHLSNLNIPSRRLHNILRACPNLRSARITQNLTCYGEEVESFPVVVVMPHLRSLRLRGSRAMQFLLENVRTPTLSRLDVEWDQRNDCVTLFPYLEAFLSQSPSVEELILRDVIPTEDALIRLITNNAHITRLVITMSWGPEYVITDRTFELLTFQEEYRVLPQLDKLVIHGGLDVKDELIAAMIASRSEPPLLSGSQAPTGTGLNHVLLSRRIPMASDVVAELERRYPGASISGGKRFLYQA